MGVAAPEPPKSSVTGPSSLVNYLKIKFHKKIPIVQTFPNVLRPPFATLPLYTTFLVSRISLVNSVKGCRLIEGVYIIRKKILHRQFLRQTIN